MTWRRRVAWLAGWMLVVFVALAAVRWLVRFYEPGLAFFPTRGEDATPGSYGAPFTPLNVTTADGQRLRVWHLTHENARALVVYFHGNGGNLSLWSDVLVGIAREGFDVIAFDYRGYGTSTGTPSEPGLYADVDAVLTLVDGRLHRPGVPLVYWGRSLGSTMAAYGAAVREPAGVILESGFPSMRAVVRSNPVLWLLSWFSSYEFPTARWMARTKARALVLHGDRDSIIPYALGQQLYEAIPGPKQFVTLAGGDHNEPTPPDAGAYWRAVKQFVSELANEKPRSAR